MYWIYLALFILAVLVPDLMQGSFYFLSEIRAEELLIFLLGMAGFLLFIFKEHQLSIQEEESAKSAKKLFRATKDLAESYGYIGEVNRKMEILMQIALGLADQALLNKTKEKEIYHSIINTANFIMKADCALVRFVNIVEKKMEKEIKMEDCKYSIKNNELLEMDKDANIKKTKGFLIISSHQVINNIKSYIIINGGNEQEEKNQNNENILKLLASQALFLFSYMAKAKNNQQ